MKQRRCCKNQICRHMHCTTWQKKEHALFDAEHWGSTLEKWWEGLTQFGFWEARETSKYSFCNSLIVNIIVAVYGFNVTILNITWTCWIAVSPPHTITAANKHGLVLYFLLVRCRTVVVLVTDNLQIDGRGHNWWIWRVWMMIRINKPTIL